MVEKISEKSKNAFSQHYIVVHEFFKGKVLDLLMTVPIIPLAGIIIRIAKFDLERTFMSVVRIVLFIKSFINHTFSIINCLIY